MYKLKKFIVTCSEYIPLSVSSAYYYYGYNEIKSWLYKDAQTLEDEQQQRLFQLLKHAADLPFYKKFSVHPDDIRSFPVLTKQDLIGKLDLIRAKAIPPVLITATSGSTGEPFQFARSLNDIRKERLYVLRNFDRYGYIPGELVGALRSYIPESSIMPRFKFTKLQNILWFSAYHMDDKNLSDYVDLLKKHKIRFLFAYPSSAYVLARFVIDKSLDLPELKALFLSSEKMVFEWFETIQKAFPNAEIIDRYGTAELSNSFIRCSKCNGYHINEDYSYTELLPIPGDDGRYEIVGTGFLNTAFPMIRYNMKDVFRLDAIVDSHCEYGSKVYQGEIEGRVSDLIYSEGKSLPGVNFYTLFYHFENEIKQFQLVQNSDASLVVNLVLSSGVYPSKDIENRVYSELVKRIGNNISVSFEFLEEIPRDSTTGKIKNIISLINQ